jgi:site-specific recombinase XerD
MIAAGVNAKALQAFMGHANISVTLDRYGHLMPGLRTRLRGCWTPTSPPSVSGPRKRLVRPAACVASV